MALGARAAGSREEEGCFFLLLLSSCRRRRCLDHLFVKNPIEFRAPLAARRPKRICFCPQLEMKQYYMQISRRLNTMDCAQPSGKEKERLVISSSVSICGQAAAAALLSLVGFNRPTADGSRSKARRLAAASWSQVKPGRAGEDKARNVLAWCVCVLD